jgi:hypothetical protein
MFRIRETCSQLAPLIYKLALLRQKKHEGNFETYFRVKNIHA